MKIKFRDLELAVEYIKKNNAPESLDVDDLATYLELSYIDFQNKPTKLMLYASQHNVTPEVRVTTKLYKQQVVRQETPSVDD